MIPSSPYSEYNINVMHCLWQFDIWFGDQIDAHRNLSGFQTTYKRGLNLNERFQLWGFFCCQKLIKSSLLLSCQSEHNLEGNVTPAILRTVCIKTSNPQTHQASLGAASKLESFKLYDLAQTFWILVGFWADFSVCLSGIDFFFHMTGSQKELRHCMWRFTIKD